MSYGHACPVCRAAGVPYFWATCAKCWRTTPRHIRGELLNAWRSRIVNPVAYQEALAAALKYHRRGGQELVQIPEEG